jgi:hypothetical protein
MDRLETVLNDAAGQLPDDYQLRVVIEGGCVEVVLKLPDGETEGMYEDKMPICDQVQSALRRAIAHAESANMDTNDRACEDKCRDQALREDEYERQRRGE